MFKKIIVALAMVGIVGGTLFAPLFDAKAQALTTPTGVSINISDGGVDATNTWTIKMDIKYDYTKYGQPTAELVVAEVQNGGGTQVTLPPVTQAVPDPDPGTIDPQTGDLVGGSSGPVSVTGTIKSQSVLRKGYSYSATVRLKVPDKTIAPAVSNVLSFTLNADGSTSNQNNQVGAQTNASAGVSGLPKCNILESDTWPGCFARGIYYVLFVPSSFIFSLSGQFLDWGMGFTLDSNSYRGSGATFVEQGWKIARDIANIMFIFILLWVGIGTILDDHHVNAKKTIGMVIVIALLLNFSLFFARVIIDASNILGGVFYNNIGTNDTANVENPWISPNTKNISVAIVSKFNPQTIFQQAGSLKLTNQSGVVADVAENGAPPASQFIIVTLIMTIINCVGIWVFLSVGLLFVSRVAGLWILMIFAPIAFISYIMPSSVGSMIGDFHHSKWWGNLARQAFVVPLFMFFMYLILAFMNTNFFKDLSSDKTTTQMILGVAIPLAFIAILLTKARKMAVDMSGQLGGTVAKWGTAVAGGAVGALAGAYAVAGRATVGRLANIAANSEGLKNAAAKSGVAGFASRLMLNTSTKVSTASFDARNTAVGNKLSSATGMNLNKGLSLVGLDTKSTDGGWQGLQARKAEKDDKYGKELGYDEHAYKAEEEKIKKEQDKEAKYKDIKEDLANKIRFERERVKTLDGEAKKDAQKNVAELTQRMGLVDQNLRAFQKGGTVFAMNAEGKYVDKDGKVVGTKGESYQENTLGIQKMEKNKERIKTAREKEWQSTLMRRSGKRYIDDERDELGNIKDFGKEITPAYKKELEETSKKNEADLITIENQAKEINQKVADAKTHMQAAMKMQDKELIESARKELEQQNDANRKITTKLTEARDKANKTTNALRKVEGTLLKTNWEGTKQIIAEFGEGFAKGSGAVVAGAAVAGFANEGFAPGTTLVAAGIMGGLAGIKKTLEYSGKTNQAHAAGHLPHYHGGHTTYHEPHGGSQDTPSAPSGGGDHGGGGGHGH